MKELKELEKYVLLLKKYKLTSAFYEKNLY